MKMRVMEHLLEVFQAWRADIIAGFKIMMRGAEWLNPPEACQIAWIHRQDACATTMPNSGRRGACATIVFLSIVLVLGPGLAGGAVAPPPDAAAVNVPEPMVMDRGPHHRTWQTVRAIKLGDKTILRTNSYQEL